MKKIILIMIMGVVLIGLVSATLPPVKQGDCVELKTILNTTTVTISTITYPNGTVINIDSTMTKNGKTFNYTFCDTDLTGSYIYDYYDNEGNVYVNDFPVNKTGKNEFNIWITIILIVILLMFNYFVIYGKNQFVGGITFLIVGVFISFLEPIISFVGMTITIFSIGLIVIDLNRFNASREYGQNGMDSVYNNMSISSPNLLFIKEKQKENLWNRGEGKVKGQGEDKFEDFIYSKYPAIAEDVIVISKRIAEDTIKGGLKVGRYTQDQMMEIGDNIGSSFTGEYNHSLGIQRMKYEISPNQFERDSFGLIKDFTSGLVDVINRWILARV